MAYGGLTKEEYLEAVEEGRHATPEEKAAAEKSIQKYRVPDADLTPHDKYVAQTYAHPYLAPVESFGKGLASDLINLANITPPVLLTKYLARHGEFPGTGEIPQIPGGDPSSLSYRLGQVAGAFVPYAGAEAAIESGASHIPGILGALGKSAIPRAAMAGALTGGGIADPNTRLQQALFGGLAGGLGESAIQGLSRGVSGALKAPAVKKLWKVLQSTLGDPENPAVKTGNEIAHSYKYLKKISDDNYDDIFSKARGHLFGMPDLVNYKAAYESIPSEVPKNVLSPVQIEKEMGRRSPIWTPAPFSKGIDPERVNQIRSDLLTAQRDAALKSQPMDSRIYSKLANSLHTDLKNYFNRIDPDLLNKYLIAQRFYRDKIVPFQTHPGSKEILRALRERGSLDSPNGEHIISRMGKEITSSPFIPKANSQDVSRLEDLSKLVGAKGNIGDYKAAMLGRNMVFEKASSPDKKEFLMKPYLKKYNSLSTDQRNFMFSPIEQRLLNTLSGASSPESQKVQTAKALSKVVGSALGAGAAGATLGSHFGVGAVTPGLLAGAVGALKSAKLGEGVMNLLGEGLTDDPVKLARLIKKSPKKTKLASRVVPPLPIGISQAAQEDSQED